MRFQRYEMPFIRSNMYVAVEGRHALVVDPVLSEEGFAYLRRSGAADALILLTHEHFDHTNGVNTVRAILPSRLVCTCLCADSIADERKNRPQAMMGLLKNYGREELMAFYRSVGRYSCHADETFSDTLELIWEGHRLQLRVAPGHSPGSCCIEMDSGEVFTGDSLIPREPVITRFPGGSAEEYEHVTLPYLRTLAPEVRILPGHGLPCSMEEFYRSDKRFFRP